MCPVCQSTPCMSSCPLVLMDLRLERLERMLTWCLAVCLLSLCWIGICVGLVSSVVGVHP